MVAGEWMLAELFRLRWRADQQPVLRSLELRDDLFPALEGNIPSDDEQRPVRQDFGTSARTWIQRRASYTLP